MYGRTNAGGGVSAKGFIQTTYPEGSNCTCSDGSRTLKAKDTSGFMVFLVPYIGKWTVTATDGTATATQTVEITSEGQSVSVELSYVLFLYNNGIDNTALTGGWTNSGYSVSGYGCGSVTNANGVLTFAENVGSIVPGGGTANKIDVTKYNTLRVKGTLVKTSANYKIGLWSSKTLNTFAAGVILSDTPLNYNIDIDISSCTGEYYVASTALGTISEVELK